MLERDDPKLRFLPEADVLKAGGIVMAYHDRWWSVCPERGLIFYSQHVRRGGIVGASPQCNSSNQIAHDLNARMYSWAEVKYVKLVLQPVDPKDYA